MLNLDATALVIVGACGLLALILALVWSSPTSKLPPGPPGLPLLGNLLELSSPRVHRFLLEWSNQFGAMYTIKAPGVMWVVVTDPALYLPLLGRGGENVPKAKLYDASWPMAGPPGTAKSLFSSLDENPQWKSARKGLAKCFSNENVRKMFPPVRDCCKDLITLMTDLGSGTGYKESLNITDLVVRTAFDSIGQSGFSMEFHALRDYGKPNFFLDNLHDMLVEVSKALTNPLRGAMRKLLFFTAEVKAAEQAFKNTWKVYKEIMDELRSRPEPEEDDLSISSMLMKLKDPETGEPLPDRLLMPQMAAMLIGGFDTGSYTIQWLLFDLATQPEVQAKVKAELEEAGLLHKKGCEGRELEYSKLHELPYFNACLKESMRMHPVAATGAVRQLQKETQVGDYVLPPKCNVWLPFIAVHNTHHNWEEPDSFKPERWIMQKESSQPGTQAPLPYLPFSEGVRNCVGMNLGYMTVRTILLSMLSHFWFELDESKMGDRKHVIENSALALVLTPASSLYMRVRPHT